MVDRVRDISRLDPPKRKSARQSQPAKGIVLTRRTSLDLPPRIPLDEWSRIGRHIFAIADSSAWWLGDWLIYGQSQYPDRYKRAIEETGLDYQTLRNYAWVARRYPESRRRGGVSFQHHAEVASLPAAQQDEWLDRAEKQGWSRNELRRRIKAGRDHAGEPVDEVLRIQMNIPSDRRQRWVEAASAMRQDLAGWIVANLDSAASAVLEVKRPEQLTGRRSA
jgi:hypothetical protein